MFKRIDHIELLTAAPERTIAFYVGALGSRQTHQRRVELLRELGAGAADIERLPKTVFEDRPALIMRAGHPLLKAADPATGLLSYPWLMPSRETHGSLNRSFQPFGAGTFLGL